MALNYCIPTFYSIDLFLCMLANVVGGGIFWYVGFRHTYKRRVHPLLKKILDPPLHMLMKFLSLNLKGPYLRLEKKKMIFELCCPTL